MRKPQVRAPEPGRVELKSRYLPSGEKRGFEPSVLGDVYRVASPPATGTTHTSLWRLFSASRTVVTVNATSFPSGETAGPLNVVTLYQSAGVNARFAPPPGAVGAGPVWAPTGNASATHRSAIAVETERVDAGFTIAPRSGESLAVSECTITHRRLDPLACRFFTRSYRRHRFETGHVGSRSRYPWCARSSLWNFQPRSRFSSARTGPASPR